MDGDHQHNHLKRKEPEDSLDLTLQLGVGNSRDQAESSNSQAVNQANSSSVNNQQNQVNPELGFAMMAGEQNNPWRNVRRRSNGSTSASSQTVPFDSHNHVTQHRDVYSTNMIETGFAMMAGEHNNPWQNVHPGFNGLTFGSSHTVPFNYHNPLTQHQDVYLTDVIETRSRYMYPEPHNQYIPIELFLAVMLSRQFDDLMMGLLGMDNNGEDAENETDNFDLPEYNFGDLDYDDDDLEYDDDLDDLRLDIDDMSYEDLLGVEEQMGNVRTGLTEDTISALLRCHVYQPNAFGNQIEPARCCICLEDFSERDLVGQLDCGHDYHYGCIKEWLVEKNECPLCKSTALSV